MILVGSIREFMKIDYSFQKSLIKDTIENLLQNKTHVLAAAPGAGKTNMALAIIKNLKDSGHIKNALVFAHGQTIIRKQWCERASSLGFNAFEFSRDKHEIPKRCDLVVTLPHKARQHKEDFSNLDLLIVDEAHHFFTAIMVSDFIQEVEPKYVLCLTGTPSKLILLGHSTTGITVSEMMDHGVASDPRVEIWKSGYEMDFDEFTRTEMNPKEQNHKAVRLAIESLGKKHDLKSFLKKAIISVSFREEAVWVRDFLKKKGVNAFMCIYGFKDQDSKDTLNPLVFGECDVAVVVNKGILGFDFPNLEKVIDITHGLGPDRIFQMMCRLIRPSKISAGEKLYIKFAPNNIYLAYHHIMSYVVAMITEQYYYRSYRYFGDISAPLRENYECDIGSGKTFSLNPDISGIPEVISFSEMRERISSGCFTDTTFSEVKSLLLRGRKPFSIGYAKDLAKEFASVKEFRSHHGWIYDRLRRNIGITNIYNLFGETPPTFKKASVFTEESARSILKAHRFENRHDLKRKNLSLYKWLLKYNRELLQEFSPSNRVKWSLEKALKYAKQFKSINELSKDSDGCHRFLKKNLKASEYNDLIRYYESKRLNKRA